MDWRPGELNTSVDHVADCVMAAATTIDTLRDAGITSISDVSAFQVFIGGGFDEDVGGRQRLCFSASGVRRTFCNLSCSVLKIR